MQLCKLNIRNQKPEVRTQNSEVETLKSEWDIVMKQYKQGLDVWDKAVKNQLTPFKM